MGEESTVGKYLTQSSGMYQPYLLLSFLVRTTLGTGSAYNNSLGVQPIHSESLSFISIEALFKPAKQPQTLSLAENKVIIDPNQMYPNKHPPSRTKFLWDKYPIPMP